MEQNTALVVNKQPQQLILYIDCRCYRFTLHHVSDQYFTTGQNGVEMDVLVYQDYSMFYFILVTISKISTEILRKGKKN